MSTRKDIAEIIGYMKLAFPNYSPDVTSPINTLDVLLDLLGDIPVQTMLGNVCEYKICQS